MLKKLKLELDVLAVESFATQQGDGTARGTVRAHTGPPQCHYVETDNAPTCLNASCGCAYTWTCGGGTSQACPSFYANPCEPGPIDP